MLGYGDEEEAEKRAEGPSRRAMNRFAELLDRLAFEPSPQWQAAPDRRLLSPDAGSRSRLCARGDDRRADRSSTPSPRSIRALIAERTDPVLFAMSYDYVGDLSETVALMWPAQGSPER